MAEVPLPGLRKVVGVWCVRDGRMLLVQRSGGRSDGMWVPPGGVVDPGEDVAAAAIRETFEESGLRLDGLQELRQWVWETDRPTEVMHFVGAGVGEAVRISTEHYDFKWLTPAEYMELHLPEAPPPRFAQWFLEMRRSAEMVQDWIERAKPPPVS